LYLDRITVIDIDKYIEVIQQKIYVIQGQKVMLDRDLAEMYQVPTKMLNLYVKRNLARFPSDFMVKLTKEEFESLRLQFETSKRGGTRYLPYAFTELGIAMLSSVLNSAKAIQVNIMIMRAFVLLRQNALNFKDVEIKIAELERTYNKQFKDISEALDLLLSEKQNQTDWENRERIGFKK
jgi:hypothetical protein